jgi:hypothetical protein
VKRTRLAALVLLVAGCGIQPSGVTGAGQAPTGLAPGATLYFLDTHEHLQPQLRRTGHLESVSEVVPLLLTGPGDSDLHTEIAPSSTTQVIVTTPPGLIQLVLPLTINDVTPLGIDQIVCTALAAYVQAGGSKAETVQLVFTLPTSESGKRRTCPLIS